MKYCHFLFIILMIVVASVNGQESERSQRTRVSSDIDRRTKRLYDQAIDLMEYKQYDRGLEMLSSIVRDHQGTMLAHMAHMAIGKHYLEQRKHKECLSHFMLLTRLLAPVTGETQKPEEIELYNESLFRRVGQLPIRTVFSRISAVPQTNRSSLAKQNGQIWPTFTSV
jgi:hypothetical protein